MLVVWDYFKLSIAHIWNSQISKALPRRSTDGWVDEKFLVSLTPTCTIQLQSSVLSKTTAYNAPSLPVAGVGLALWENHEFSATTTTQSQHHSTALWLFHQPNKVVRSLAENAWKRAMYAFRVSNSGASGMHFSSSAAIKWTIYWHVVSTGTIPTRVYP